MRGELGSDLDKSTSDLSPSTEHELTKITFDKLVLGEQYDVLDASHRWCEGEVCGFCFLVNIVHISGIIHCLFYSLGSEARSKDGERIRYIRLLG